MRLTLYEVLSLRRIQRWEHERQRGLKRRLLELVSHPVEYAIDRVGRNTLDATEEAIRSTVERLLHVSSYAVNPRALVRRARAHGIRIRDLSDIQRCDLRLIDRCNRRHIRSHALVATVQGAVLGLGGAFAAAADVTGVLVMDFHLIQEMAFCYGFDPNDPVEKEIVLRVILAALGSSEIRRRCLEEIELLRTARDRPDGPPTTDKLSVVGTRALEKYIEHLTLCLLIRAVPHLLPVISVITGALSNREVLADSGRAGFMVYRRRFIERKRVLAA
jgi:hypothetical protein